MKTAISPTRQDYGLALLRVAVGFVFLMHGWLKFFGMGIDGVTGFFTSLGIPAAGIAAPLVASVELFGGLALIAGLLTRWAALGTAGVVAGAIFFAKRGAGFFAPQGFELELTLLAASLAIALAGAGALSLDGLIRRRRPAA